MRTTESLVGNASLVISLPLVVTYEDISLHNSDANNANNPVPGKDQDQTKTEKKKSEEHKDELLDLRVRPRPSQ
jgi:hypothetical protein